VRARLGTVDALVRYGAARFRASRLAFGHGTTGAWDEAVYLTLHALKLPLDELEPHLGHRPTPRQIANVLRLFERRIRERTPAAYLTHEAWLGDFRFYVDERVIVPRSYIAELLRADLAPWVAQPRKIRTALDLCTGSGCLAVLLAYSFPRAEVDAVDIEHSALGVARRNIANFGLKSRVKAIRSDLFAELGAKRYDLIISNPPYVKTAAMRRLPPEFRREPKVALAGGRDGLDVVRTILRDAAAHMKPGGLLVVEVGHNRSRVEKSFPRLPFTWLETSGGDDCVFLLEREQLHPSRGRPAAAASPKGASSPLRSARSSGPA
jgi:ribosomal protein L3 glutamine methyltransferase